MLLRTLKYKMRGIDVYAHKRGIARMLEGNRLKKMLGQLPVVRNYFGKHMLQDVKTVQRIAEIPQTGVIGPRTHDLIYDHMDDHAIQLLKQYEGEVKPKLIEPNQGWGSLHSSLWVSYSEGRRMGMSDLGTYNPDSRLPSGRRSDHGVLPAFAFDLGISPDTGWSNQIGRTFAERTAGDPGIEYVILGDRIWTRDRGWHTYHYGNHNNHVHVSGIR